MQLTVPYYFRLGPLLEFHGIDYCKRCGDKPEYNGISLPVELLVIYACISREDPEYEPLRAATSLTPITLQSWHGY